MEARRKAKLDGVLVTLFLVGSIIVVFGLMRSVYLDGLAKPTAICKKEIEAVAAVFLVSIAVLQPAKDALSRSRSSSSRALQQKIGLPKPVRAAALAVFAFGMFGFTFWTTADVLGGYNGYNYSFSKHPILQLIFNNSISLIPYLKSFDKGAQASFYLSLVILGLVAFRLNRGIWIALKDVITLFAAPCLVVFELALWYFAPEDMTWHVTDFLWIGGANDGGYKAVDFAHGSGPFLVSNWLVLFVAFCLVASRIPWLSLPSRMVWRRKRRDLNSATLSV